MNDELNKNFCLKRKISNFNNLNYFLFLLKIIYFIFGISLTEEKVRNLINFSSEVHLVIMGKGNQNLLSNIFSKNPSQVIVNGINRDSCNNNKICELEYEENNVTLIFNDVITSTSAMFNTLNNIKEIDLSLFDFSKVNTMRYMFRECTNLEKIEFGNINTSSVTNMEQLFFKCQKLVSVDVSKFDTSNVVTMQHMFFNCFNLTIINLSNFNP